jgi:hypothetical protein
VVIPGRNRVVRCASKAIEFAESPQQAQLTTVRILLISNGVVEPSRRTTWISVVESSKSVDEACIQDVLMNGRKIIAKMQNNC